MFLSRPWPFQWDVLLLSHDKVQISSCSKPMGCSQTLCRAKLNEISQTCFNGQLVARWVHDIVVCKMTSMVHRGSMGGHLGYSCSTSICSHWARSLCISYCPYDDGTQLYITVSLYDCRPCILQINQGMNQLESMTNREQTQKCLCMCTMCMHR